LEAGAERAREIERAGAPLGILPTSGPPKEIRLPELTGPGPGFEAYQREVLEAAEKAPPLMRPQPEAADWRPPTLEHQNPYSKMVMDALSGIYKFSAKIPGIRRLTPLGQRPYAAFNLLREKYRIADATYQRLKETYVNPIKKLSPQTKAEVGLMINKYIPVEERFAPIVKAWDVEMARFGKEISNLFKEWAEERAIRPEEVKLTDEIVERNVGRYARTFYLKDIKGERRITPSTPRSLERISQSMFQRKMTDEDWGKVALLNRGWEPEEIDALMDYLAPPTAEQLKLMGKEPAARSPEFYRQLQLKFTEAETAEEFIPKSIEELKKLGREEKVAHGWVYLGDAMMDKTARDLANQWATMTYLDAIYHSPQLFSKTYTQYARDNDFIPVSRLLPPHQTRDVRLGPLNEGYVHPAVFEDLKVYFQSKKGPLETTLGELLSWYKIMKVPFGVGTSIRNAVSGNYIQTDMHGMPVWSIIPFRHAITGKTTSNFKLYKEALKEYITKTGEYIEARNNGQFGSDYYSIELEPSFIDKFIQESENPIQLWDKILEVSRKGKEAARWYGSIDHIGRLYAYKWARAHGATPAEAVYWGNKIELDYRFVGDFAEALRKGAVGGWFAPFLSFYWLQAPRVVETTLARPWKMIKWLLLAAAISSLAAYKHNLTKEQVEAMKPKYLEKSDWVVFLGLDKNGDPQYLNLGYTMPFGSDWKWLFLEPKQYAQLGLPSGIPGVFGATLANYDPYFGKPIYDPKKDTTQEKNIKVMWYVAKALLPTLVTDIERLYRSARGEMYGYPILRQRTLPQAIMRNIAISIYSGGVNEYIQKIEELQNEIRQLKARIRIISNDPNLSQAEIKSKTDDLKKAIQNRIELLRGLVKARPSEEVIKKARERGLLLREEVRRKRDLEIEEEEEEGEEEESND